MQGSDAQNRAFLEKINRDRRIYLIGSEFTKVAPGCEEKPDSVEEDGSGDMASAQPIGGRFYLRFAVCHERATSEHATFAYDVINQIAESKEFTE